MTGQELIKFIEKKPDLLRLPINYTLLELLKTEKINPSTIIDAYTEHLNKKIYRLQSHYDDAVISAIQLITCKNDWKGEKREEAENRFLYNTSFNKKFPNLENLSEEEKQKWSQFYKLTYGFKPEDCVNEY